MKYEYTLVGVAFKAHGKLCWMPFVETTICGTSGCRTGFALVDSGAVDCLINKVLAGFIESDAVDIILGQDGFFDRFRIKFEKDHNVFEISHSKK